MSFEQAPLIASVFTVAGGSVSLSTQTPYYLVTLITTIRIKMKEILLILGSFVDYLSNASF